ncbi:MAG: DUF4412 domain-containing protein [Gemmatimonadales bacterium]|nr:DUF4412 domain-containing protein [Gemmatimonadales bacterium]
MSARGIISTAMLVAALAPAGAQAPPVGTFTLTMGGTPPPALAEQAPMAAGMTGALRFTLGSDGTRLAAHAELNVEPDSPQAAALAGARLMAAWKFDADSVGVAMSVPESMRPLLAAMLAAEAGSPPEGYHMTIKLPDLESAIKNQAHKIDSDAADDFTSVALGTRSTVAGIACEEWRITSPRDTMTVCAVESSASSMALVEWFMNRTGTRDAADDMTKRLFGGRKLTPIRAVAGDGSFRMELESSTAASPPAAFFAIPAGYHAIDADDLPFGNDGS